MKSYATLSLYSPRNYSSLGALSGARFPPSTVGFKPFGFFRFVLGYRGKIWG